MLFTDSHVADAWQLRTLDPEVDSILLGSSGNICAEAWSECRGRLESALASFSTFFGQAGQQAHLAAVMNASFYGNGTRARLRLNQIVVSDFYYAGSEHPLQRWVVYTALKLLFQTAANRHYSSNDSKKGDRFEHKFDFYEARQKEQWRQILNIGMPFVLAYLDCPGSLHGWNAGLWSTGALSTSADPSLTNATAQKINVAVTYSDASSYISAAVKNNAESGPSAVLNYTLPPDELLNVSIAGLNPPTPANAPNTGISQGIAPMRFATHWNVYAALDSSHGAPLYLQNGTPIPLATTNFTLPAALLTNTPALQSGQVADSNLIFGNVIVRG